MHVYMDYQGKRIRLTEERLEHILEHPNYRWYVGTYVGDKHLCVVVKMTDNDAFVLTAYLATRLAGGRQLWPKDD